MAKTKSKPAAYNPKNTWKYDLKKNGVLYLIFLIPFTFLLIFKYIPMVGILMAFQDYKVAKGLFGSPWVGLDKFKELFAGAQFGYAFRNTVYMALLNLTLGFIIPVILGLLISQVRNKRSSRVVQTITYMPYFVAPVVVCTLAKEFLKEGGAITMFLTMFGLPNQNWLAVNSPVFWFINCFLGIWQGAGYGAIVYIAAINGIDQNLYEAACIDGASRWQRLWNITIPSIVPLVVMMFTMQIGLVFMTGFDKVLLLYMPTTYEFSDCLSTYTYRMAFSAGNDFSLSTASGLLQSIIGTLLLIFGNKMSEKATKMSLF